MSGTHKMSEKDVDVTTTSKVYAGVTADGC